MFQDKTVLLLDMNNTFMFGEDRFGDDEDFYSSYRKSNGQLSSHYVNRAIRQTYAYLDQRYPLPQYRESFPKLEHAMRQFVATDIPSHEFDNLMDTFAQHEIGDIPLAYRETLQRLSRKYTLALVIDIWSPKQKWLDLFKRYDLSDCFAAASFSSDHGIVKPSPIPMERLVMQLQTSKKHCLFIGDSIRRDLGAALAAQVDCVLVSGETHCDAVASYNNLLQLANDLI